MRFLLVWTINKYQREIIWAQENRKSGKANGFFFLPFLKKQNRLQIGFFSLPDNRFESGTYWFYPIRIFFSSFFLFHPRKGGEILMEMFVVFNPDENTYSAAVFNKTDVEKARDSHRKARYGLNIGVSLVERPCNPEAFQTPITFSRK